MACGRQGRLASSANRLAELARKLGVESYMVDSAAELQTAWFEGRNAWA